MGERSGLKCELSKLWRLDNGHVLALCGWISHAGPLRHWYEAGAKPEDYPKFQEDAENSSTLLVLIGNRLEAYGPTPYPVHEEGRKFTAFGSGRDFAIAAMALGKNAVDAVQLAARFDVNTGMGVDYFILGGDTLHHLEAE